MRFAEEARRRTSHRTENRCGQDFHVALRPADGRREGAVPFTKRGGATTMLALGTIGLRLAA